MRRAHLNAAHCHVAILESLDGLAGAKVRELDGARVVDENVRALDVAVN